MKNKLVVVHEKKSVISSAEGFQKKLLADDHIEVLALCGFGCSYCSSNNGFYLRTHRQEFLAATQEQLGAAQLPGDDPSLTFIWPKVLDHLNQELSRHRPGYGKGRTLVFSMLTDAFSPWPLQQGITRAVLELLVQKTAFRIRVLTKNAVVGNDDWIEFFRRHPSRFVVGLSTGTTDDAWARRVEVGTSQPFARLKALRALQDAGVPTYGMLCPVFPNMLDVDHLEQLVESIHPAACEHVWAEPFNDRVNWKSVRDGYAAGTATREFLEAVYDRQDWGQWSRYATQLYLRLRQRAEREGWLWKLRYLLYEDRITAEDSHSFSDLKGVLLQAKPDTNGLSKNPHFAAIQRALIRGLP